MRLRRNCYIAAEASAKDKVAAVAQLYPDAVFSGTAALAAYGLCEVRLPAVSGWIKTAGFERMMWCIR